MIYIIEGPDNVGKGTQIRNIKKYLEEKDRLVHVMHYSNIKGQNIEKRSQIYYEQMFQLCQFSLLQNFDLILDRAHLGEYVYSPIYRNYSGKYVFDIEKKFDLDKIILFVFTARSEDLISREDGLSFSIELDKKQHELDFFKKAFELSNIKHKHLIDITNKDIDKVWKEIEVNLKI
jgi:thymidylate kinase